MSAPYAARIVEIAEDLTVPGRFSEAGLHELAAALGGDGDPSRDPWEALAEAFAPLTTQQLGERLLDAVLLQPPIPAGCEALLRRMATPGDAPWVDHEVPQDRFQLWYCHNLVHRVQPDVYPAPTVAKVSVELIELQAGLRTPGKRSPPRDRTAFLGRVLRDRPGDNPLRRGWPGDDASDAAWAYDVVWSTIFGDRGTVPAAEITAAFGLTPDGPAAARIVATAWLAHQWLGDAAVGQAWATGAHIDPVR